MKDKDRKLKILVCADRAGYGHIRGMLGITDILEDKYSDYIESEYKIIASIASEKYSDMSSFINEATTLVYEHFTDINTSMNPDDLANYAGIIWDMLAKADHGQSQKYVIDNSIDLVVGAYPVVSALITTPGVILGLDPYPPLYITDKKNFVTTAVDVETMHWFYRLGAQDVIVTGAMIPYVVVKSRAGAKKRIAEVRAGKPLRISISTGGSLTHGLQITELTKALHENTKKTEVEKIFVVVGNSDSMLKSVTKAAANDPRIEIIFDKDQVNLVRRADDSFAKADIIIAKTGEIPQCVIPGGKAFKTFDYKPAMGPQEFELRRYPEELSRVNGLSALEQGIPPKQEIERILKQKSDGTLAQMMENGLRVPASGTENFANYLLEYRKKLLDAEQKEIR